MAVIGISDPMGDRTGWYGMHSEQGSGTYEVIGYPSEQGTALTADSGHVDFENGVYDISDVYHSFGSSGGPILNDSNEVCGVVSSTLYGDRIDGEWDTLMQWMSGNDTLIA